MTNITVTGATGFIGRYLVESLVSRGHTVRALRRKESDISGLPSEIEWVTGDLTQRESIESLLEGAEKVVHAAVYRPTQGWSSVGGKLPEYLHANFIGSIELFNIAEQIGVDKLVYLSSCAVHDIILPERTLDEAHPLWAKSHYGAHKAAVEKFIHSFGYGMQLPFCALRPTGVYGLKQPREKSKWFDIVQAVVRGESVRCQKGGKEVHVGDVVKAIELLLDANNIAGESYNCYDRYVSEYDVAMYVKEVTGSKSDIDGAALSPKNQIDTEKIRSLGMEFGGTKVFQETIQQLIDVVS